MGDHMMECTSCKQWYCGTEFRVNSTVLDSNASWFCSSLSGLLLYAYIVASWYENSCKKIYHKSSVSRMAAWQGRLQFTEVSSKCHGWTTSLTTHTWLCMLCSSRFECEAHACIAIVADPAGMVWVWLWLSSIVADPAALINSCMSACVVTYTWIAFNQALAQVRPIQDDAAFH